MPDLSCPTCNRSTYAPWRHYDTAGKLTEACCDMSHERYIGHVGAEYGAFYYDFWRKTDAKVAEIRSRKAVEAERIERMAHYWPTNAPTFNS